MTTYPTLLAGQTFTASLARSMLPLVSLLSSSSASSISNTTLMDSGLSLDLEASATYLVLTTAYYVTPAAADMKTGYSTPTGATGRRGGNAAGTGAAATDPSSHRVWTTSDLTGGVTTVAVGGSGTSHFFYLERVRIDTTNAGTLKFQFAQVSSTATDTFVLQDSSMVATRVA